ncbi:DUF3014 domain-containing protein [Xanthomonas campestris pv. phormiicola]|nr:DUF3014 domain-containing protein [Xanthomonas campestris pv. phormiicola]UYC17519.1 DUF3014 domain-containing protein [Xanthomonas campestris pv. phormiicola]
MQPRHSFWPWILVAVLVAAAASWLFRDNLSALLRSAGPAPATVAPAPASGAAPPAPAAAAAAAPAPIQHPIDPAAAADAAIPALADSDAAAWAELATLAGSEAPLALLIRDHLIQRAVTMIDNLPQRRVAARTLVLKPVPGQLQVATDAAGASVIDAANAQRYAPYVQAFTQADAGAMVAAYRRFYPLFQQAYVELGYPKGYFNDRLVQVIDHLHQAPVAAAPPAVTADARTGKYRFVDPALESLSVGQKALLRLGPAQAEAVRTQLQAIRAALIKT